MHEEENDNQYDYKYEYQLLDRLKTDCEYYLNNGYGCEKNLWANNVESQISKMKELWEKLPSDMKPDWLSMEDIQEYEEKMLKIKKEQEKENEKFYRRKKYENRSKKNT